MFPLITISAHFVLFSCLITAQRVYLTDLSYLWSHLSTSTAFHFVEYRPWPPQPVPGGLNSDNKLVLWRPRYASVPFRSTLSHMKGMAFG